MPMCTKVETQWFNPDAQILTWLQDPHGIAPICLPASSPIPLPDSLSTGFPATLAFFLFLNYQHPSHYRTLVRWVLSVEIILPSPFDQATFQLQPTLQS